MTGFELLLGHLVGDYIFQTDYLAANKSHPWPVKTPRVAAALAKERDEHGQVWGLGVLNDVAIYTAATQKWWLGNLACTVHCILYTLAIAVFSWWWMPWWGYLVCFLVHWPIDRFKLAYRWMQVAGQSKFASGPLSPWSIAVVDNIMHLLTLYFIAKWGMA